MTILAQTTIAAGLFDERLSTTFIVEGGLHYIKGNRSPHFSLTYTRHRKGFPNHCWSGGAGHELIVKLFPRFADLAALHLSDMDGSPMYAVANGYYNLAGALGGWGQRFHVCNSKRHFPKAAAALDPAKPWETTDYREPTRAEAMQLFADYLRIPLAEAKDIAADCKRYGPGGAKDRLAEHVDSLRPRWKAEAEACIAKHGLVIFGDVAAWDERQRATESA